MFVVECRKHGSPQGRSWVLCEGGCPVNSVAKFGDFWRLVVEVLQWKRCVGSFEEKSWVFKVCWVILWVVSLVSSSGRVPTGERNVGGCVLDVYPGVFVPGLYWFFFLAFLLGFLGCTSVLSMAGA